MHAPDADFRDRALASLTAAFGPAKALPVEDGTAFYRWILHRPGGLSIYLTLNSQERTEFAHLLVSDPGQQGEPVASFTLRLASEVQAAIERIMDQWKGG